jgi:hypothetical protein
MIHRWSCVGHVRVEPTNQVLRVLSEMGIEALIRFLNPKQVTATVSPRLAGGHLRQSVSNPRQVGIRIWAFDRANKG